jgi:hypothetical protein
MGRVSVFEVKPYLKYKIKSLLGWAKCINCVP